jgi:predicted oxidoreductase
MDSPRVVESASTRRSLPQRIRNASAAKSLAVRPIQTNFDAVKQLPLGKSEMFSSRIAYGCWRLAGTQNPAEITVDKDERGIRAAIAAYEAGFTLFDHADVYCRGEAERLFGKALKQVPGMRERIVIASKCGIRMKGEPEPDSPYRYDVSAEHIIASCDQSLRRLGVETIDLYQLHRVDYLCDPHEVAGAFDKLRAAGKVRHFGVSNFRPSQLTVLQKACPMPLVVNQVEISLFTLDRFDDGTLDQCMTEQITPLAWSPLAGGRITETLPIDLNSPDHAQRIALRETLDLIARERGTSRLVIALAWLLKHPARIIPILGSTNPQNICEATKADALDLSRDEWYRLMEAARGQRLP